MLPVPAFAAIALHVGKCWNCGNVVDGLISRAETPDHAAASSEMNTLAKTIPLPYEVARLPTSTPHALDLQCPTNLRAGIVPAIPEYVGQYRLLKVLDQGGMGIVFLAQHMLLEKPVAVKLLTQIKMTEPAAIERFKREWTNVGKLSHPNIVNALDAGNSQGVHYLVMELIDGVNFCELLRRVGPLPIPEACELIRQVAIGLDYANTQCLVHRDIKLQNLMLSYLGEVKILDLGLAILRGDRPSYDGLTGVGQQMGTPDFMAPEQWNDSHSVDIRADLYSLGCTLYYLLTGRPPFVGAFYKNRLLMPPAIRSMRPAADFSRVQGNPKLVELLTRLLADNPDDRPTTPKDILAELAALAVGADLIKLYESRSPNAGASEEATITNVPTSASPTAKILPATIIPPRKRRHTYRIAAAGLIALCIVVAVVNIGAGSGEIRNPSQTDSAPLVATPHITPQESELGKWKQLLTKEPYRRIWTGRGNFSYDAKTESFWMQTNGHAVIPLGETQANRYRIQIGIRQSKWTGSIGLYFGGRPSKDPDHYLFQLVRFLPDPTGPTKFNLTTSTCDATLPPGPRQGIAVTSFAGELLTQTLDNNEQILELAVQPQGRVAVRWNGIGCPQLAKDMNMEFNGTSYCGEFGIYCNGSSAGITSARILQLE